MLPQQGRPTGLRQGFTALEGETGIVITPGLRVINSHIEAPRSLLAAMKHLGWRVVRCQRYPVGLSFMIQPRFAVLTEPIPEVPVQLRAVPGRVPKPLRSGPVRMPQELDQVLPLVGFQRQELYIAVLSGQHAPH